MRLVKSQKVRNLDSPTPESVFAEKYDWLLRWAMHFTQNDLHAAEDLAQETFVRLLVSWPRIKDNIGEVEPFLYSTLRYAHLMELRRGRRFNFQDLTLIEFDDLRLSLQEEKTADPIEVQDDLRRIVAYLCWRKQSVKSASILLLRFFHGYFPEEIARIALLKRRAVDKFLRVARDEVKAYMADASRVEIIRQGKPPELMPKQIAVPADRFAEELRTTIFEARTIPCPDRDHLLQRYRSLAPKPIPHELLGHLVSCERCLSAINSFLDFPPPSQRSLEGMDGASRRFKRPSGRGSGPTDGMLREDIRRVIAGGLNRFRKLYEHHPRGLMIVVNGDVLAMRDVNSATSELKVQMAWEKAVGIIDVLSEQGLSLLNLHVRSVPPEAPPELRHEIALSDNRKLELLLRFTTEGALIELHYNDPLFLPASDESLLADADADLEEPASVKPTPALIVPRRRSWWRRVLDRMTSMALPEMNPMLATAMICMVAAIVFLFLSFRASSVMKPEALLTQAATSETASARSGASGVIVQAVRIQTRHRKVERTLYRDVQGKRRLRERPTGQDEGALRSQLESFGIAWNDPLSAGSFRDWHDHASVGQDVVKRTGTGLLTLTTTLDGGAVASESLTVRESDFHPVDRTVELRNDAGTVEIAELNYSVLPWSSVNPDLFESMAEASPALGGSPHAALLPHLPASLSVAQIDDAELEVRLVLNRLHLDTSGRIELSRQADGVHVQGVVESDAEKRQLQSQLTMVPHVRTSILTIREMETRPAAASDTTSIHQSSMAVAEPSALEKYFLDRGMDRTAAGAAAQEFVDSSFAVKHESEQITALLDRFSSSETLSTAARTALSELLIQHKAALLAALGREDRQLTELQLVPHSAAPEKDMQGDVGVLRAITEHNFALCVELISSGESSPRPAQSIAPQLATSIAQLRAVVLHISAAAPMSPPASANAATANQK